MLHEGRPHDDRARSAFFCACAARTGSTLIIVAGLASLLLLVSVTFLQRIRADSEESALVVRDTQARIMLVAALQYIQETSRLGWRNNTGTEAAPVFVSDAEGGGDGGPGYECYGWTDVRDGSIGPRGPRVSKTVNLAQPLPVPTWWTGGAYPHDADGDPHNPYTYAIGSLPANGARKWPCPGSAMRGDMFVYEATRHAIKLLRTPNPYRLLDPVAFPNHNPDSIIDNPAFTTNVATRKVENDAWDIMTRNSWGSVQDPARFNLLDPQPLADTLGTYGGPAGTFRSGNLEPRIATTDLSWFRIYRELPTDHDNDGVPWFDRVPLQGHGTFIIACGAGGTAGYRFWDTTPTADLTAAQIRDLEPVTAQEAGLFGNDKAMFDDLRAHERILWYRAEWTAMQGGGANILDHVGNNGLNNSMTHTFNGARRPGDNTGGGGFEQDGFTNTSYIGVENSVISFFGAIKWIQRLEEDPITW
jgi:hypothetical protein